VCTRPLQGYDWGGIWERVQHLVVKSLISVQPIVRNNYRSMLPPDNDGFSCFEILGCVRQSSAATNRPDP